MGSLDKTVLIPDLLKVRGLLRLQVDSYNHFLDEEIKKIIARNSVIESSYDPEIYIRFTGVSIGVPSIVEDFCTRALTPHICRLTDTTYSAPIKVNVTYTQRINNVLTTLHKKDITIGSLPIMLRSNRCVLNGKDEIQHARLGECPLDPGGYFIIKGSERVVIIQEDTVKNKIMLEMDTKGRLVASVTSCTPTVQSKAVLSFNRDVLELELDAFSEPVPIVFVLKAMGILCAKELVEMTGKDPKYAPLIDWSVEMSLTDNIRTQEQALAYLDGKVNINWLADRSANMVHEDNLGPKCTYVAVMIEFLLEATLMKYILDDQNHEGNKRYQLSGDLLSLLFEDLFKKMNTEVMKQIDMAVKNKSRTQYYNYIMRSGLTQGLERALYTGNWDLKLFKMHKTGITQVLSRLSFIASLGHMTRISSQVDMSKKVSGPRQLHSSQWGMICPCDTPVGEGCGLVKNLALVARFSTKEQDASIISLCHTLGVKEMEWAREAVRMDNSFLVFYNGLILGKHERPQDFANGLRELRRSKSIGECVSVFVDDEHRCVNIASDGGRPCRPLVIADKGVSRITERHLKQMRVSILKFSTSANTRLSWSDGRWFFLLLRTENSHSVTS